MTKQRERCDHCKKWVYECQLSTLEGLVQQGVDINFAVCTRCSIQDRSENYWDTWVSKQTAIAHDNQKVLT